MNDLPNSSWRSLELLCRQQAALSSTPDARNELERMELEYKRLADWSERQWPATGRALAGSFTGAFCLHR